MNAQILITLLNLATVAAAPTPLRFDDLLVLKSGGGLEAGAKLKALVGRRVSVVGFMARMENPPRGAFYLVPRPLSVDESGAGSADLPPQAIRVVVRSAAGKPLEYVPRALQVTGVLELGGRDEADGLPSVIRIILDPPPRHRGSP
jgi:hypothetical protein